MQLYDWITVAYGYGIVQSIIGRWFAALSIAYAQTCMRTQQSVMN